MPDKDMIKREAVDSNGWKKESVTRKGMAFSGGGVPPGVALRDGGANPSGHIF